MGKVIQTGELSQNIVSLKISGKRIVLVGGCFDVLHPGHVIFLQKAKECGDILIVFLESDEKVKELKGIKRPVHTSKERALILSTLSMVDYVVMLPFMKETSEYDKLVERVKPDVIAATKGDVNTDYHQRSAKLVGAEFKFVTNIIGNHSSSKIVGHKI